MDPQQELFSAVLMALKEKYKDTGVGVYDTILPPKDTPYPFIYLADCSAPLDLRRDLHRK